MSIDELVEQLQVEDGAVTVYTAMEEVPYDLLKVDLLYTVDGFPGFQWIYAAYYVDGVYQRGSLSAFCENVTEDEITKAVDNSIVFAEELYLWEHVVESGDYDNKSELITPQSNCLIQYYCDAEPQLSLMFLHQATSVFVEYPGYDSIFCISFDFSYWKEEVILFYFRFRNAVL